MQRFGLLLHLHIGTTPNLTPYKPMKKFLTLLLLTLAALPLAAQQTEPTNQREVVDLDAREQGRWGETESHYASMSFFEKFINLSTPNRKCGYELRIGGHDLYEFRHNLLVRFQNQRHNGGSLKNQYEYAQLAYGNYNYVDFPLVDFSVAGSGRWQYGVCLSGASMAQNLYNVATHAVVDSHDVTAILIFPYARYNLVRTKWLRAYAGMGLNFACGVGFDPETEFGFTLGYTLGTRIFLFGETFIGSHATANLGVGYRF